jgi:hypothetical protein
MAAARIPESLARISLPEIFAVYFIAGCAVDAHRPATGYFLDPSCNNRFAAMQQNHAPYHDDA